MSKLVDYARLPARLEAVHKELDGYQVTAIKDMHKYKRVLLDSGMGSGKTLMCLTTVFLQEPQKVLVLCSKNAMNTWRKEIKKWFPEWSDAKYFTPISGKIQKAKRAQLWAKPSLFYVTTYSTFLSDKETIGKIKWDAVVGDEAHKAGWRNSKTQGFKAAKELLEHIKLFIITSGTPTRKGPQHLWGYLHILARKIFTSYWKFVNAYCIIEDTIFGKQITGVKNTEQLEKVTRECVVRIPREITDKALPPIVRDFLHVDMTPIQAKAYEEMDTTMILDTADAILLASTSLTRDLRLRQILSCPWVCGTPDHGGGIEAVVDKCEEHEDFHCVIFTPFRDALPHFRAYLQAKGIKNIFQLQGGMEPAEVARATTNFRNTRGVMLCTIQYAQSFELETAKLGFFIGYSWDQDDNFQAEARMRRFISTKEPVFIYYCKHENTIDDRLLEVLGVNTRNNKTMVQDIDKRAMARYNKDNNLV